MDWKAKARLLVEQIAATESFAPEWREAFSQVPRHVFVPKFYRHDGSIVDGADPAKMKEWLDAVYSDVSLTTQVRAASGSELEIPTSSSTRPSLMMRMLRMLSIDRDSSVLEIGSGTGYNAALISHRIGDHQVTSIDIDSGLAAAAATANLAIGLKPYFSSGDGWKGCSERAPYNRIIATCAVSKIPGCWISQLDRDGIIVTDMRAATSSCLVALHRSSDGCVEGRFDAAPGNFMWLRPNLANPYLDPQEGNHTYSHVGSRRTTSNIDPELIEDPGLGLMVAALVPNLVKSFTYLDPPSIGLRASDGSWSRVNISTGEVIQAGDRSIWDEVESANGRWDSLGRPDPTQFFLTAYANRRQQMRVGDNLL